MLNSCLRLLTDMPETVCHVCELLTVSSKRNGDEWRDRMLADLFKQVGYETLLRDNCIRSAFMTYLMRKIKYPLNFTFIDRVTICQGLNFFTNRHLQPPFIVPLNEKTKGETCDDFFCFVLFVCLCSLKILEDVQTVMKACSPDCNEGKTLDECAAQMCSVAEAPRLASLLHLTCLLFEVTRVHLSGRCHSF